ncbi:MAG: hypothetical protein MZV65_31015 [Chromatiales bacterium]|nr:hypothetical protein [Chromatiales bacterium]
MRQIGENCVLTPRREQLDPAELPLQRGRRERRPPLRPASNRRVPGMRDTVRLIKSLNAWGMPEFDDVLKRELEQLDPDALPLQQGLSRGSYALGRTVECRGHRGGRRRGGCHPRQGRHLLPLRYRRLQLRR